MLHRLEGKAATQVILNSSTQEICLFSPNYLCILVFISIWTHGYLLGILGYNPNTPLFILLFKLFQL